MGWVATSTRESSGLLETTARRNVTTSVTMLKEYRLSFWFRTPGRRPGPAVPPAKPRMMGEGGAPQLAESGK